VIKKPNSIANVRSVLPGLKRDNVSEWHAVEKKQKFDELKARLDQAESLVLFRLLLSMLHMCGKSMLK
jgi:hypothetical protein